MGGVDRVNACIDALRFYAEKEGQGSGAATPVVNGNTLVDVNLVYDDVVEVTTIKCTDDSIVLRSRIVGALSRARSIGVNAYSALLKAALESNLELGPGKFIVDDGSLVLVALIPYSDVKGSDVGEGMRDAVGFVSLLRYVAAHWVKRSLASLEKGGGVERLVVKRELESMGLRGKERNRGGDSLLFG